MAPAGEQRKSLEADLGDAQPRGELELYYQPIVNALSRKLVGFEALMRWNFGMIAPTDFIPLAEETEFIVGMGAWALKVACQEAMRWSKPVKVMVNLSPWQFEREDLYSLIDDALARSGLPARRLELEITEGLLLRDDVDTKKILHKLRVASRLMTLVPRRPRSAICAASPSTRSRSTAPSSAISRTQNTKNALAIVTAITGLARQLQMTTVPEGVETLTHVNSAIIAGCGEMQGYFFRKPVPATHVEALLTTWSGNWPVESIWNFAIAIRCLQRLRFLFWSCSSLALNGRSLEAIWPRRTQILES